MGIRGRSRSRWEDNVIMDFQEVGWGGRDRFDVAEDKDRWWRLVNAAINFRDPYIARNFLTRRGPVSFSGRIAPWSYLC